MSSHFLLAYAQRLVRRAAFGLWNLESLYAIGVQSNRVELMVAEYARFALPLDREERVVALVSSANLTPKQISQLAKAVKKEFG